MKPGCVLKPAPTLHILLFFPSATSRRKYLAATIVSYARILVHSPLTAPLHCNHKLLVPQSLYTESRPATGSYADNSGRVMRNLQTRKSLTGIWSLAELLTSMQTANNKTSKSMFHDPEICLRPTVVLSLDMLPM